MERGFENTGKLVALIAAMYLFMFFVGMVENRYEKLTTQQIEIICTVVDKDKHSIYTGNAMISRYTLELLVSDADEEVTYTATVTGAAYNDVQIGDEIKCIAFYKDGKMIKIELAE